MKFEWDDEKNKINFAKHGIDFETAMLVFNDLQRIEIYDMEHSKEEDRYNTIGMVNDVIFVVLNRLSRYKKQQKEKLYMMMIHRNLLLQWKRHFDWLQRIEIHIKIQQFHNEISVFSVKVSFGGNPPLRQQSPTSRISLIF